MMALLFAKGPRSRNCWSSAERPETWAWMLFRPDTDGEDMEDVTALAAAVLDAQPFSRLLGTELIRADEQGVELALAVTPDLRQQHGFAHGGVIAYLADNALTFAGGIGLGTAVLTSQMNIHYLSPARGGRLVARAAIITLRPSSALTRCDLVAIEGGIETSVAFATALIRRPAAAAAAIDTPPG